MSYVVKSDYKTRIDIDLLDKILTEGASNGDDILTTVSKMAEDTINTLAGVLYDLTAELVKTGDQRNHLVLLMALNIATYQVYQRIDDETVPEKVIKNHDDTMEDLVKISLGRMPLNLPPKSSSQESSTGSGNGEDAVTDGGGLRRIGSQPRRSNNI